MRIVAVCAWFREPLEFLDRMVRSLAGHVDGLVCLDGAWEGFPGAEASSGRDERDTIRAAASEADVPCRVSIPKRVWESQIEKRQALLRLAAREHDADWVLVVDGDVIVACCDDSALRASLELTGLDVAEVLVRQLNLPWPYSEMPQNEVGERHLYRAHTHITVERAHNGVRIGNRWLNGDPAWMKVEPALDLTKVIRFDHDNMNRGDNRVQAAREYRRTRREEELETWR